MSLTDRIQKSHGQSSSLLSSLSSTYSDYTTYPQARDQALALQSQLNALTGPLGRLHFNTEKELRDFQELDKSSVRKGFSRLAHRTDKWEASKDKEEQEWKNARQKEEAMKNQQTQLQQQLSQTEQERDRTESNWHSHTEKQAELDNLYNSTFAGPTPEYPEQEHARANFDAASVAYNDAARQADTAARALKCLTDADKLLHQANIELANAKDMSDMDMFIGGAGISAKKRDDMNRSQRALMIAERSIFEAHTLTPEVRLMDQMDVGAQGSGFTDVMFDNIFTDMRVADEIKASAVKVQKGVQINKAQVTEAAQRLERRKDELVQATGRRDDARWELQRLRADIFERVAGGWGNNRYAEVPPPPY